MTATFADFSAADCSAVRSWKVTTVTAFPESSSEVSSGRGFSVFVFSPEFQHRLFFSEETFGWKTIYEVLVQDVCSWCCFWFSFCHIGLLFVLVSGPAPCGKPGRIIWRIFVCQISKTALFSPLPLFLTSSGYFVYIRYRVFFLCRMKGENDTKPH